MAPLRARSDPVQDRQMVGLGILMPAVGPRSQLLLEELDDPVANAGLPAAVRDSYSDPETPSLGTSSPVELPVSPVLGQRSATTHHHLLSPPSFLTPQRQIRRSRIRMARTDRVPLTLGTMSKVMSSPSPNGQSALPRSIYTLDARENPLARQDRSAIGGTANDAGSAGRREGRWWDVEGILDSPEREIAEDGGRYRALGGKGEDEGEGEVQDQREGVSRRANTDPTAAALSPRPGMGQGLGPDPYDSVKAVPVAQPAPAPDPESSLVANDDSRSSSTDVQPATPSTPLHSSISLLPSPSPSHAQTQTPGGYSSAGPNLNMGTIASALAEDIAPVPNPLFVASIALSVIVGVLIVGMVSCSVAYCRRGKWERRHPPSREMEQRQADDSPKRMLSIGRSLTSKPIDSRTFLRSSDTLTSFSLPPPSASASESVLSMSIVDPRASTYGFPYGGSQASIALPVSILKHPPAPRETRSVERKLSLADALATDLEGGQEVSPDQYQQQQPGTGSRSVPNPRPQPALGHSASASSTSRRSICATPPLEPIDENDHEEASTESHRCSIWSSNRFQPSLPSFIHSVALAGTAFHSPEISFPRPASRRSSHSARSSVSTSSIGSLASGGDFDADVDAEGEGPDFTLESISSISLGSPRTPRPSSFDLGLGPDFDSPPMPPCSSRGGSKTRESDMYIRRHTVFGSQSHAENLRSPPVPRVRFAEFEDFLYEGATGERLDAFASHPVTPRAKWRGPRFARPQSLPADKHVYPTLSYCDLDQQILESGWGRCPVAVPDPVPQSIFKRALQALTGSLGVPSSNSSPDSQLLESEIRLTSLPPVGLSRSQRRQSAVYPARSPVVRVTSDPGYRWSLTGASGHPLTRDGRPISLAQYSTESRDYLHTESSDERYPVLENPPAPLPRVVDAETGATSTLEQGSDSGQNGGAADNRPGCGIDLIEGDQIYEYDEDEDDLSVNDARISFGFLSSDLGHLDCAFELAAFPEPASHLPHIHVTSH